MNYGDLCRYRELAGMARNVRRERTIVSLDFVMPIFTRKQAGAQIHRLDIYLAALLRRVPRSEQRVESGNLCAGNYFKHAQPVRVATATKHILSANRVSFSS